MTSSLEGLSLEEKRELLARMLRRKVMEEGRHPLSSNQLQLWLLDQVDPGNITYTLVHGVHVGGSIDAEVAQRALDEIVRRHESLRTTFDAEGDTPFQRVAPSMAVPLQSRDLRPVDRAERDAEVQRIVRQEAHTSFSLTTGPLLRFLLLRLDDNEYIALIAMHHIISDGWSIGVFVREFGALYEAFSHGRPSPLPPLSLQLKEYIRRRQSEVSAESLERLSVYWQKQLGGAPTGINLTPGRIPSGLFSNEGAHLGHYFPGTLFGELKSFSIRHGVTLYMTLLAGLLAVLYRWTGQEDLLVASPMADRERPEAQGLIAFMVNSIFLRVRLGGNPTVQELLSRVREAVIEAQAHQELPFDRLIQAMQRVREPGYGPLTQVLFAYQNMPLPPLVYPGLRITWLDFDTGVAPTDLWAQFIEKAEGFELLLVYKTALFERTRIEQLARDIERVLEAFVAEGDLHLAGLPLWREAGAAASPAAGERHRAESEYCAPRTPMEVQLARLWAETLGLEKVGLDDDFFALGGHSLLVIQVINKMNERLGIVLPFKALFESPTVRQLATRMDEFRPGGASAPAPASERGAEPLVLMQAGPAAPTLYCFHQAGGQIHSYTHLARALHGQCRVYGVQSRAAAEPSREHQTFSALTEDYADLLLKHQPGGPYFLAGYSTAGALAAAVAQKLEEAGRRLGLVALIDPVVFTGETRVLDNEQLPAVIMSLRASFGEEMTAMSTDDQGLLRELTRVNARLAALPQEERMESFYEWLRTLRVPGEAREALAGRMELSRRHYELFKAFRPVPIGGPVYLCRSTRPIAGIHIEASLWDGCARGRVHRETVDEDHFAMMRLPCVQVIAGQLTRLLSAPPAEDRP